MVEKDLLVEWLADLVADLREEIGSLTPEQLSWQPDPEANSIGITVWHISRWLDVLTVRTGRSRPAEEEVWHTQGWAKKTGYDPRGIGSGGLGTVSGYTWDEVQGIPTLTADEHLTYLSQTAGALSELIEAMPAEALHQPAPGSANGRTIYQTLKPILQGCFGHLGEIQTLKAMLMRQTLDLTGAEGTTHYVYVLRPHRLTMLKEGMRPEEEAIFEKHWTYLTDLTQRGIVLSAGRTRNVDASTFGLCFLNTTSEEAAKQIMENDPGVKLGLMHGRLHPYRIALMSEF